MPLQTTRKRMDPRLHDSLFSCSRTAQTKFTGTAKHLPLNPSYYQEFVNLESVRSRFDIHAQS